jgi:hypothetical protein
MYVYDVVENGTVLNLNASFPLPSSSQEVKVYMNNIYVGDRNGRMLIYDINDYSLKSTTSICGSSIVVDSINFDLCHGSSMITCRQQNRFQYIHRDGTTRFISLSGNPRVLFFDYRRRLWINEGTTLRIYN